MPDPMTVCYEGPPRAERVEVITSVQRRRRWSTEEKVRIVEETYLPGNSVSLVARHHGIAARHGGYRSDVYGGRVPPFLWWRDGQRPRRYSGVLDKGCGGHQRFQAYDC